MDNSEVSYTHAWATPVGAGLAGLRCASVLADAGREVQVLYAEPGAWELYFFVNGRLDRIVK